MKTNTEKILVVMKVLTWCMYIGLMIHAGALLFTYSVSLYHPGWAKNLFAGLDLSALREADMVNYSIVVLMILVTLALKIYTAQLVIKIFSAINMTDPFKQEIANLMEKVSYVILLTWAAMGMANAYTDWLIKSGFTLVKNPDAGGFLFQAGIIFIFAQVFKKGIELKSENDLTI